MDSTSKSPDLQLLMPPNIITGRRPSTSDKSFASTSTAKPPRRRHSNTSEGPRTPTSDGSHTPTSPYAPVSPNTPVFPSTPRVLHRSISLDDPGFSTHRYMFPDNPEPPDDTEPPDAPIPPNAPVPPDAKHLLDQQAKKKQLENLQEEVFTSVVSDLKHKSEGIIDRMFKYAQGADKLYQRFRDNPGEILQNHDTKKGEEARLYDEHVEVVNQTIAWYHLEGIKQMSKLLLRNRRGFAEIRQWISQACEGQARLKHAERFDTLFDTISSQSKKIDKRKAEIKAHLAYLDKLQPTNISMGFALRQWQAGKVKEFGQQAAKRAEELEGVLNQLQDYKKGLHTHIDTIYQQNPFAADLTTLNNFATGLQNLEIAIRDAKNREDRLKEWSEVTDRLLTTNNKIERANNLSDSITKVKDVLKGETTVNGVSTALDGGSLEVRHTAIETCLQALSNQGDNISKITKANKERIQEENDSNYIHIINKLREIKNGFLTEASEKKEHKARGHFIWFLKYNHATINKVWTDMRCIKGFRRNKSNTKDIEVLFRSDITAFAEHRDSRDASRIQQQEHKVKTLEEHEIQGDNFHLTVKIPGNNYQHDERKHGIISLTKNINPEEIKKTQEAISSMRDSVSSDSVPSALREYIGFAQPAHAHAPEVTHTYKNLPSKPPSRKHTHQFGDSYASSVQSPLELGKSSDYFSQQGHSSTSGGKAFPQGDQPPTLLPKDWIKKGSELLASHLKYLNKMQGAPKPLVPSPPEASSSQEHQKDLIDQLKKLRPIAPEPETMHTQPQDPPSNNEASAAPAMSRSTSRDSLASSHYSSFKEHSHIHNYLAEVTTKAGGRASKLNVTFTYSQPKASKMPQEDIEQIHQFIGDIIKSGETPSSNLLIDVCKITGLRTVRSVIGNVETEIKILDMERTKSLDIVKNLVNEKGIPTSVDVEINRRVLPEPIFNIDAARKTGPGYGIDDMKQMRCIIDLGEGDKPDDPGALRIYNREIPLNIIDFTETNFDQRTKTTSIQFQGEKGVARINLNLAASKTLFDVDGEANLKSELVAHASKSIDGLLQAIATQNPDLMRRALEFVEKDDDLRANQIATIKKKLEAPPRTEQEFEASKKKAFQTREWLGEIAQIAKEMVQATQNYNEKLKKPIQVIHEKKPLYNRDLLKSMADPVKHTLMKHASSKQKLEYRKQLNAAEHLDTRYKFTVKPAPWERLSETVERQLTGLELLQEYDRYTGESFIKQGEKLTLLEQQEVTAYTQEIKDFICNPDNGVHSYYKNLMNLRSAIEAYDDTNNTDTKATEEYIRHLDEGIAPLPSDNLDLDGHRRIDEAGWVNYLKQMVVKAHELGTPELLKSALSYVKWMRTAKYINLEIATKCLDLDTTTDEAKQLLGKMRIKEILSEYEQEEKSDVATKAKSKDKSKLELKSPEEAMKEMLDSTHLHIQNLIDSTSDLALKQTYREMSPKLMEQMLSHKKELYVLNQRMDYEWLKLDEGVKKMRMLEWENFWRSLVYFWISKVGDATKHIGHAWNRFFNLFFPGGGVFK